MMIDIHQNCPFCRGRINDPRHEPLGGDCPVRELGEHQVTASEARERLEREAAAKPEDRYMSVEWMQADERRIAAHQRLMADYLAEVDKLQDYERPPLREIAGEWIDEAAPLPVMLSEKARRAWSRSLRETATNTGPGFQPLIDGRVIVGIDPAEPGSDHAVVQGCQGAEGGNVDQDGVDELVMVADDPVRVITVALFDGRTCCVASDDRSWPSGTLDLGAKAQRVASEALSCYQEAEILALHQDGKQSATFTVETWERCRFQALPDEEGYGRIIDNVWPADALRIRGACPRTGGHHRPADRGRYCRKCGRSREH